MPRERILITGANGHLGRRLLERIAREPGGRFSVRALVRSRSAAEVWGASPPACVPKW